MSTLQSWIKQRLQPRTQGRATSMVVQDANNGPALGKESIVQLTNIHKTYLLGLEGVPALRGVSVSINRGEWVVIYGTSGGGKTSLLNLVGTIDKPTKGEMRVCGTVINNNTSDEELALLRLHSLGFVFQTFNLLSSMTARENVELPMTLKGSFTSKERKELAKASLQRVGLGHRLDHFPSQLSGGEQQRVTIARAIANKPALLLLDEPTGDLDSSNTYRVIDMLYHLNHDQNMTLLMVTHDVYLKNFAHRVIFMRDGKVAREEIISEERRQAALADLYSKMGESSLNAQTNVRLSTPTTHTETTQFTSLSSHGNQPTPNISLHTAPSSTTQQLSSRFHTEIRTPHDYPTYSKRASIHTVVPTYASLNAARAVQYNNSKGNALQHVGDEDNSTVLQKSVSLRVMQLLRINPSTAVYVPAEANESATDIPAGNTNKLGKNSKSSIAMATFRPEPTVLKSNELKQ